MKHNRFKVILSFLTLLVGIFLFLEYQLSKSKYHEEKILNFEETYNKSINNYEKILDYTIFRDLKNEQFLNSIKEKNQEKIVYFLDEYFFENMNNEFKYLEIYDLNGQIIYSLNDKYNKDLINNPLNYALQTKLPSKGLFFSRSIHSFRYVHPIFSGKDIIGYIDVGLDLQALIDDMNYNTLDKVDILLKKGLFQDVSKIQYRQSTLSYRYHHINLEAPIYPKNELKKIESVLDREFSQRKSFVIDLLDNDIYLNQITFIELNDEQNKNYGYIVKFSNDSTFFKIIIIQFIKFIVLLMMVWLLYNLYVKNQESSYFTKQLLDALYKVNIVSKSDVNGVITFVNDKFCEISGYKKEELIGQKHNIVRHGDMPNEFYTKLWNTIKSKEVFNDLIKNKRKDGTAYYENSTIIPVLDSNYDIKEFIAIRNDVGTLINAQKQLFEDIKTFEEPCCINIKIDHYDMYTNIYPTNFLVKLEQILLDEIITLKPKGLDLDKTYNILDGEYAYIFDKKDMEVDEITILMKKFLQNLNRYEIKIDNYLYEFKFMLSFTTEAEYALENQKIAMKKMSSKELKESFFCSNGLAKQSQEIAKKNLETMKMIEDALMTNNVVSYFQPIYNTKTNKLEKYESLVRIIKDDKEISPFFFMDVAKKSMLYKKITIRVLENSFAALDKVEGDITINLSASDIEDLDIRNLLLGYFTTPEYYGRVTFEFLEDETIGDFEVIKDFISLARIMGGVKLAIDDFGSGYSNYERLVEIKPEIVKIDGSLIKDIVTNEANLNIVKSIVQFAKNENILTVAEFVSDEKIFNCIKSLGIDYAQGYYLGKPHKLS